jgi:hypothetical protein
VWEPLADDEAECLAIRQEGCRAIPYESGHFPADRHGGRSSDHHPNRPQTVRPSEAGGRDDVVKLLVDRRGMASAPGRSLAGRIGGCYHAAMAKKPPPRRRTASTAEPFFDLLEQMEALTITVELDWPDNIRADAQRRLNRIARALRHAPETRDRFDV